MSANILLECNDFDELIAELVKGAEKLHRPPSPLPIDAIARAEIVAAIDSDHSAWQTLLFEVLAAISLEKRSLETLHTILNPPPIDLELKALSRIRIAKYGAFFDAEEVRVLVGAIERLWKTASRSPTMPSSIEEMFRMMEQGPPDDVVKAADKEGRKKLNKFKRWLTPETKKALRYVKFGVIRMLGYFELTQLLEVLRDFFRATTSLRERVSLAKAHSTPPDVNIDECAENGKLDAEVREWLAKFGVALRLADGMSLAQKKYVVWRGLNRTMTAARIRDHWNREYPMHPVDAGKPGSAQIRQGIKRADSLIVFWKTGKKSK